MSYTELHINDTPIVIDITGPEGNAYYLLGVAQRLGKQIFDEERTADILVEMRSSDYENLLNVFEENFGSIVTILE